MSKYTAEQVEDTRRITPGVRGEMLGDLVALLRERESAKAAVTDEVAIRAIEAAESRFTAVRISVLAMRASLEAVAPMLASAHEKANPVAWQFRSRQGRNDWSPWMLHGYDSRPARMGQFEFEYRPLYTTPQEDFPALYALQGKRVRLVMDEG